MDNRRQHRVSKNLLAKISTEHGAFFGYVQDLAPKGLGMTCNRDMEPGTPLTLELNVPKMPTMQLAGRVAWRRSLPSISRSKFQYGVALPEPPDSFTQFVRSLLKRDFERRGDKRFTDVLAVDHDDVLDLIDAATSDISAGGMYIRTSNPLAIGNQYELKLNNDRIGEPIFTLVEVTAVFDTDPDDLDHPYGAGVKFISFGKDGEQRFAQYIQSLEELFHFHWPEGVAKTP